MGVGDQGYSYSGVVPSAQRLAHRVGGLAAHAGQYMAVSVEGYGEVGVSE